MRIHPALLLLPALAVIPFAIAESEGKRVAFDQLPAAVAKAIRAAAGDAKLKEVTRENEDGVKGFEAVWTVKGRQHEITVAENGKVLSEEQIIALEEAPAAVRAAIAKEAGGGKVTEVERVKEHGKTFFEAVIKTRKGELELKLSADGKVLEREKGDDEKD